MNFKGQIGNIFEKAMNSFTRDPALSERGEVQSLASVVPNNNVVAGGNRTVFQQLDAGNNVNRSVANIQVGTSLSAKKAVTNGAEAAKSLSAGKQQVAATAAAMKSDWAENKAQAMACLKEAAENKGFDGDAVVAQICSSGGNDSGLGSMVTANNSGGFMDFKPSKQDKNLKPEELKALMQDTVKIAQSSGTIDTRMSFGSGSAPALKGDIAKLDEGNMEKLLTQNITDQPEYEAVLNVGNALDEVAQNHGYVSNNYNPTDVADVKYDSTDVDLRGEALQGIVSMEIDAAVNDAYFDVSVSDISDRMSRVAMLGDNVPAYSPPQPAVDKVLGLG